MGIRKRNAPKAAEQAPLTDVPDELQEKAQEVMKDNLEMMRDIVMKIREDPDFASGIYKDCPRLQHLLDQYPDLRPVFEDPKLVKINFETVYREAGGVLPGDEEKKQGCWKWFVNSPFFKVVKFLLFIKKLMGCIAGGGFALVTGAIMGCCFEDALDELDGDGDGDGDAEGDDYEGMDENKRALNLAADHMEDPEVQENMQRLLDDPDNLEENIENDEELKALRDSNPLCEELMQDPETMKVLVDPDNLRALGECPELIEADFMDPDGFAPDDVEMQNMEGMEGGYDTWDGTGGDFDDFEIDVDEDVELDDDGVDGGDDDLDGDDDGEDGEEEEEEGNWFDDAELEEQEPDEPDNDNDNKGKKAQKKPNRSRAANQADAPEDPGKSKFGGIMASIGAAATDLIAAQIVGSVMGDVDIAEMGDSGGGGGGDLGGLGGDDGIGNAAENATEVVDDDVAGVAEDTVDEVDEKKEGAEEEDDGKKKKDGGAAAGGAAGGAAAGAAVSGKKSKKMRDIEEGEGEEEEEEEEESKTKKRFGGFLDKAKDLAAATATAAKETVAGAVLGDDWGEALVERMEDGGDDDEEDDEEEGSKDGEDDDEKKKKDGDDDSDDKKKKKKFFGRSKKD
ncbi:unnamed protein product [Cylindrotheca closterium]|uniref:Uncharacterized protein n=1 Tax=Cylindrotheca closterium TaxID=2856 RepID=A0AAD2CSX0_9STRA|nr:unnamed protein product [Cylindrotheca closterium]